MKKIFIITYNPKEKSLKEPYIQAYIIAAKKAGNEVRTLNLHRIKIDYLKFKGDISSGELTPELSQARENMIWADQVVMVYSVWCVSLPAKFKAFIERVLEDGTLMEMGLRGPRPTTKGKTAVIMQSYNMPYFVMKYLRGDIPFKTLQVIFSKWCGFKIEKRFDFAGISFASEYQKQKWMKEVMSFASSIK